MASRVPSSLSIPRKDWTARQPPCARLRGERCDQLLRSERSFTQLCSSSSGSSNRYAPVGAANDPNGLSQHHARNLIRLYAQAASTSG